MIETSLNPPWESSETFGNLRKFLDTFMWPSHNFCRIFGKWSEIFGESSKTLLSVFLYNKKKEYMVACGYGISLLVFNSISHSFAVLTHEISSWTIKDYSIPTYANVLSSLQLIRYYTLWWGGYTKVCLQRCKQIDHFLLYLLVV